MLRIETKDERRLRIRRDTSAQSTTEVTMCLGLAFAAILVLTWNDSMAARALCGSIAGCSLLLAWWRGRSAANWHRVWEFMADTGEVKLLVCEPVPEGIAAKIGAIERIAKLKSHTSAEMPNAWSVLVFGALAHVRVVVGSDEEANQLGRCLSTQFNVGSFGQMHWSDKIYSRELLAG